MKIQTSKKKFFLTSALSLCLLLIIFLPVYLAAETDSGKCADFLKTYQPKWEVAEKIFYPLEAPIGNTYYVEEITQYLILVYNFAVSAAGILAVVVIMFGGMSWAMSAGNEQKITAAKETIISAVIGLILVLGSYVILNFIIPQLVNIDMKILEIPLPAGPTCEDLSESSLVDGTNDVITLDSQPLASGLVSVGKVCSSMKTAINNVAYNLMKLNQAEHGKSINIRGSAWRSEQRQWELRQCYCNSVVGSKTCDDSCNGCQGCAAAGCNPAAEPCKGAKHPQGLAMDVYFTGYAIEMQGKLSTKYNCSPPTSSAGSECAANPGLGDLQVKLNQVMTGTKEGYLDTGLKSISNEWWHFESATASSCIIALSCPEAGKPTCNSPNFSEKCCDMSKKQWFCGTGLESNCNK